MQYAERLTIGLEKIIQTVPAETVRAFYERWYRPENMAVVAAGDFDADAVVAMLSQKLQGCKCRDLSPALPIPRQVLALSDTLLQFADQTSLLAVSND